MRPADPRSSAAGFTLIEVLVATTLFALVVFQFLSIGTASMVSATEVRNWRIARDIAGHYLSEMQAGAREFEPDTGRRYELEDYPEFTYEIVIGEAQIEDLRSRLAEQDASIGTEGSSTAADRRGWQREREQLRRAQTSGMSLVDYQDQLREEEFEERIPSEDEYEEVAVVVYYPNVRAFDNADLPEQAHFILRAKISTMAIERLTPDEVAEQYPDDLGAAAGGDPSDDPAAGR